MNHWRLFLLLACIPLSGCTLKTGSRPLTPPAPASTGSSQAYTYSTPRNTVPSSHRTEVRPTPVAESPQVALLSPRMQGFRRPNPTSGSPGASAPKANAAQPPPVESMGDDKTIVAQPSGSETSAQTSTQQVVAANLFPVEAPNYVGPIVAVIILATLIYCALYKIAGPGPPVAQTNPLEGGNEFRGQYQPPGRGSGSGSRPENAQASEGVKIKSEGADESNGAELDCSDRRKRILRTIRSRITRTLKGN
jgi:hypothetical protein